MIFHFLDIKDKATEEEKRVSKGIETLQVSFRNQHHNFLRIGTSGYTYSWNKGKPTPFEWYINQGFNSIEINGSFYRFPLASSIMNWQKHTSKKDLTFSIKVHRSITHYNKLKQPRSIELLERFCKLFEPMEDKIDFWLFQMPANFKLSELNLRRIESFFDNVKKLVYHKAI